MKQSNIVLKTLLSALLPLSLLIGFSGCGESPAPEEKQSAEQNQEEPKELKEWEMSFPAEPSFDDKEFWSEPRIQFVWARKKSEIDRAPDEEIYSMKLDGSDIRLAADAKLIGGPNGAGMTRPPVRSPNNRYIAMTLGGDENGLHKALIDLKTKERIIMVKGGAIPEFNWTPDSKNVIFYVDDYMKNYNTETRALTDRPIIYSHGIYLLNDGNTFMAIDENGYRLHKFDGSLIKKIKIYSERVTEWHHLSPDNNYLYVDDVDQAYVYDLRKNSVTFKTTEEGITNSKCTTFNPITNDLIYIGDWNEYFSQNIFDESAATQMKINPLVSACWTQVINYTPKKI